MTLSNNVKNKFTTNVFLESQQNLKIRNIIINKQENSFQSNDIKKIKMIGHFARMTLFLLKIRNVAIHFTKFMISYTLYSISMFVQFEKS